MESISVTTIVKHLALVGNPFEHYTAETEPNISEYAVRPPYLQSISERARTLSSFILFGNRGAGKSATRITVFNELWKDNANNEVRTRPFVVNMTDFSSLQAGFKSNKLTDRDIVAATAFFVVEQILVWLSSLEGEDRAIYIDGLDKSEIQLAYAMIKGFYLSVTEMDRQISTVDA
jgi:hypothetical protein